VSGTFSVANKGVRNLFRRSANWEADSGNQWTVPLGGGIGQIMRWGRQPVNLQVAAYYNVARPDNAPNWNIRLQLQFLFPK